MPAAERNGTKNITQMGCYPVCTNEMLWSNPFILNLHLRSLRSPLHGPQLLDAQASQWMLLPSAGRGGQSIWGSLCAPRPCWTMPWNCHPGANRTTSPITISVGLCSSAWATSSSRWSSGANTCSIVLMIETGTLLLQQWLGLLQQALVSAGLSNPTTQCSTGQQGD